MSISQPIVERLRFISEARKAFDSKPKWELTPYRASQRLVMIVALKLNGVLKGGVSLRLRTPVNSWEEDVYGQLEVKLPGMNRALRLNPVEWRPKRYHDNPSSGPQAHRNERLWDRWHPFELNVMHGMQGFDQSGGGIAVPLPSVPGSFSEYADLCASLWICNDMYEVPPPPWTRDML